MTSKERVKAALNHQEPDHVPLGEIEIDAPMRSRRRVCSWRQWMVSSTFEIQEGTSSVAVNHILRISRWKIYSPYTMRI